MAQQLNNWSFKLFVGLFLKAGARCVTVFLAMLYIIITKFNKLDNTDMLAFVSSVVEHLCILLY